MDAAHTDTKPSVQTTNDFNTVKQTINDYMDGKLNATDARTKFQSEATLLNSNQDGDAVLKMFSSSKDIPSNFPNLSVDVQNGISLVIKPAGGSSRDSVTFDSISNQADLSLTSEAEIKAGENVGADQRAKEDVLASKALSVANDFFHGKLSMSATKTQIDNLAMQGRYDDPANPENGPYGAFEDALNRQPGKYGISLDGSAGSDDFGLYSQQTSLWSSIEIKDGKATVDSATYNRVKDDAVWGVAGAAAGSMIGGPIGAAIGGVIGIGEGELHRYQNGLAMKVGNKNIFDESWKGKFESIADALPTGM
jgi:hypothetical protein